MDQAHVNDLVEFTNNFLTSNKAELATGNYIVSPLSISLLFYALLGSGATRGSTTRQIAKALNLPAYIANELVARNSSMSPSTSKNNSTNALLFERLIERDARLINDLIWNSYEGIQVPSSSRVQATIEREIPQDLFRNGFEKTSNEQNDPRLRRQWPVVGGKTFLKDKNNNGENIVKLANAVFLQSGFEIRTEFEQNMKAIKNITFEQLDFKANPAGAIADINKWVDTNTNGLIKKLFNSPKDVENLELSLMNAVYFKDGWRNQFNSAYTEKLPFYVSAKDSFPVQMMQSVDKFYDYVSYPELGIHMVNLPLKNKRFHVTMALPLKRFELPSASTFLRALRQSVTIQEKGELKVNQLQSKMVNLKVPKFKLESEINLIERMQAIGITDAFDRSVADFSGISDKKSVFIQKLIQKAALRVDEFGVEAAAVSVANIVAVSILVPERQPVEFHADEPFWFSIVDKEMNHLPLFVAKVNQPSSY